MNRKTFLLMDKIKGKSLLLWRATFLLCIFFAFYFTAPSTVQHGDTGELVTNSYYLRVSHPPGYPLWTLLYHLPTKILGASQVFWAASLFTGFISLIWYFLLTLHLKQKAELLILGVLASGVIVWKYSVLPDVFSLHVFFLVFLYLALERPQYLNHKWFLFILSLSVAHHHTIALAFPLYLYAVLKNGDKKIYVYSVVFGLVSLSFYTLLFIFHSDHPGSWGYIENFNDLIHHFLRKDYGTLSLHQQSYDTIHSWHSFFLENILSEYWSLAIALVYFIFRSYKKNRLSDKQLIALVITLILYFLIFNLMGKVSLERDGFDIFNKFLFHPMMLFVFVLLHLIRSHNILIPKIISLLFIINLGVNLVQNIDIVNFRKHRAIEEYLTNLLKIIPSHQVLVTQGDTNGFGIYYLKEIKKVNPSVVHIYKMWSYDWYQKKVSHYYSHLFKHKSLVFFNDFKIDQYRLFTNHDFPNKADQFASTLQGLVYEIEKLDPQKKYPILNCNYEYQRSSLYDIKDFSTYHLSKVFDLKYEDCLILKSVVFVKNKEFTKAEEMIQRALSQSPYNFHHKKKLCHLYKISHSKKLAQCTKELIEMMKFVHPKYYEF